MHLGVARAFLPSVGNRLLCYECSGGSGDGDQSVSASATASATLMPSIDADMMPPA